MVEALVTAMVRQMDQLAKNTIANQDTDDKVNSTSFNDTFLQWMENVRLGNLVSSGGSSKSLHGTMLRVKCTLVKKHQKVTDDKTRMSWILGLVQLFGHSQYGLADVDSEDFKRYFPTSTLVTVTTSSSGCLV